MGAIYFIFTLGDAGLDAILQHLLQRAVMSTDGCGLQCFYQIWHLPFGHVVGDGVVPGVGHALLVQAEHAGGQSVQTAWTRLDVILGVVLKKV